MTAYEMLSGYSTLVIAIANLVMLGVIFFTYKQYIANKQTWSEDHERSRRERSLDLLMHWNINLKRQGTVARKLIENFSDEQCKKLFNQEAFGLDIKYIDLFKGTLSNVLTSDRITELETQKKGSASKITVTPQESSELRWACISYLNSLEVILAGWYMNVCDQDMIFEQFRYLVSPEQNCFLLKNFRKAAGDRHSYPNIDEFVKFIQTERDTKNSKKPLGQ